MTEKHLFRNVSLLAIVVLVVMLTHISEPATILGRYSPSYVVGLVLVALSGVISILVWSGIARKYLPNLTVSAQPRWLITIWVVIGGILTLLLAWAYLPGSDSTPQIAIFHTYIYALIIGIIIVALKIAGTADRAFSPSLQRFIPLIILLFAGLMVVLFAGRVPPSRFYEEQYLVNWAWTSWENKIPAASMIPGRDYLYIATGIFLPGMGGWMSVFGISLLSSRLYVLLLAWAGAPFIYAVARRLYSESAALIALALALALPLAHNYTYATTYVSTAVAVALFCLLRARDTHKLIWHYVCGFAIGSAFEGHQYGICFAFAFAVLYGGEYLLAMWRERRLLLNAGFWMFVAGGVTYALAIFVLRAMIWGQVDFMGALSLILNTYQIEASFGRTQVTPIELMIEWFVAYPTYHPIEFGLLSLGFVVALTRRTQADRLLLVLFTSAMFFFTVFIAHFNVYYWVHHLPFTTLFGSALLANRAAQVQHMRLGEFVCLTTVIILIFAKNHETATTGQDHDELIQIGYEIDTLLPSEAERVSGFMTYYYGLSGREFTHSGTFMETPGDQWQQVYGIQPPQAIIVTHGLDNSFPDMRVYIEDNNFITAACFPTKHFGKRVILYTTAEFAPENAPQCS